MTDINDDHVLRSRGPAEQELTTASQGGRVPPVVIGPGGDFRTAPDLGEPWPVARWLRRLIAGVRQKQQPSADSN